MREHPERMIIIAVIAAALVAIIGGVASCNALQSAMEQTSFPSNDWLLDRPDSDTGRDDHDAPGGGDADTDEPSDSPSGNDGYTEKDVPAAMDIDVPELQDDLQACINNDLGTLLVRTGSFTTVEITELTKDTVSTPELKGGRVLAKVSGKATITTSDDKTDTIDYTSYYYAADPTASKITWYIYAYDLGSYDLFPDGFKNVAGDPMDVRDKIENGIPASDTALGRDKEGDAKAA